MKKNADYYRTLQVHQDAGQEVIEAAYRRLSRMHHPDVNRSPFALEKMKMINNAYEILGDAAKRGLYHAEWLKNMPMSNRFREDSLAATHDSDAAKDILDSYFTDLVNERWDNAYLKLTVSDRERIPLIDFVEWRKAVAKVYKIGSFDLKYFSSYNDCDYLEKVYSEIHHFSATIREMKITSSTVSEETSQKYVAFDNGNWRICLGFSDLSPIILKFKHQAEMRKKIEAGEAYQESDFLMDTDTGVLSRDGFIALTDHEILRSKRYKGPLTLIVVRMIATIEKRSDIDFDSCMMAAFHVIEAVRSNIRETDLIGIWEKNAFAIVLIETALENGSITLDKLLQLMKECGQGRLDIYTGITKLKLGAAKEVIEGAFKKSILRTQLTNDKSATSNPKIGKYNLNDILGFNRPKMPKI